MPVDFSRETKFKRPQPKAISRPTTRTCKSKPPSTVAMQSPAAQGAVSARTPQTVARNAAHQAAPERCSYCHEPANKRRKLRQSSHTSYPWVCGRDYHYLKDIRHVDTEPFHPMDASQPRSARKRKISDLADPLGDTLTNIQTTIQLVIDQGVDAISDNFLKIHDTENKIFQSDRECGESKVETKVETKVEMLDKYVNRVLKGSTPQARGHLKRTSMDGFNRFCLPSIKKSGDSLDVPYQDDGIVAELPYEQEVDILRICGTVPTAKACIEKAWQDVHDFMFARRGKNLSPSQLKKAERNIGSSDEPVQAIGLIVGVYQHAEVSEAEWKEPDLHRSGQKTFWRNLPPLRTNRLRELDAKKQVWNSSAVFMDEDKLFTALTFAEPCGDFNTQIRCMYFNGFPVPFLSSVRAILDGEDYVVAPKQDYVYLGNFGEYLAALPANRPADLDAMDTESEAEEPEVSQLEAQSVARPAVERGARAFRAVLEAQLQELSESDQSWAAELKAWLEAVQGTLSELEPQSIAVVGQSGKGKSFIINCLLELTARLDCYGLSFLRSSGRRPASEPIRPDELEAVSLASREGRTVEFHSPGWHDGQQQQVREWTDTHGQRHFAPLTQDDVDFEQTGGEELRCAWQKRPSGAMRSFIATSETAGSVGTCNIEEYMFGHCYHAAVHFHTEEEMQAQMHALRAMLGPPDEYEEKADEVDEADAARLETLIALHSFLTTGTVDKTFSAREWDKWPVLDHADIEICPRLRQKLGTVYVVAGTGFREDDDRIYVRKMKREAEDEFAHIIKVIVNFLPSTLLAKGVKLVDTCGTADLDSRRMYLTRRVLQLASMVMVITGKSLEQDKETMQMLAGATFFRRLLKQQCSLVVLSTKDEQAMTITALDIFKQRFIDGHTTDASRICIQKQIEEVDRASLNVVREGKACVEKFLQAAYMSLLKLEKDLLPPGGKERAVARAMEEQVTNLGVVLVRMYTAMKLGLPGCEDTDGDWSKVLAYSNGGSLVAFLNKQGSSYKVNQRREELLAKAKARHKLLLSSNQVPDDVLHAKCTAWRKVFKERTEKKQHAADSFFHSADAFYQAARKPLDRLSDGARKEAIARVGAQAVRHYSDPETRRRTKVSLAHSLNRQRGRGRPENINSAFRNIHGNVQSTNGRGPYDVLFQYGKAPEQGNLEEWTSDLVDEIREAIVAWLSDRMHEELGVSFRKEGDAGAGDPDPGAGNPDITLLKNVVDEDVALGKALRELQRWNSKQNLAKAWDDARNHSLNKNLIEPLGNLEQDEYVKRVRGEARNEVDAVIDDLQDELTHQLEQQLLGAVEKFKDSFGPKANIQRKVRLCRKKVTTSVPIQAALLHASVKAVAEDLACRLPPALPMRKGAEKVDMSGDADAEVEAEQEEAVVWLERLVRDLDGLDTEMHAHEIQPPFEVGKEVEVLFNNVGEFKKTGWLRGILQGECWESATGVPLFRVYFPQDGESVWTRIPDAELRLPVPAAAPP